MAQELPLNSLDKMSDVMSSLCSPPGLNSPPKDWKTWEELMKALAQKMLSSPGDCGGETLMEATINMMAKVGIGERRKSNCEIALKIFKYCEKLCQIHQNEISKFSACNCLYNTAFCLHFMKQNKKAIEKFKLVKKELLQFLDVNVLGQEVIICGLKNAKHLNKKIGKIVQLNAKPNRHGVKLVGSNSEKIFGIHKSNLKPFLKNAGQNYIQTVLAKTYHHMGASYNQIENVEQADYCYTKALEFFSSQDAEKSMDLIFFCGTYLEFIQTKFQDEKSILELHDFQLKSIEEICGQNNTHYASALNGKGNYFLNCKHDFDQASKFFLMANELTPDGAQKGPILMNLVNCYQQKKDLKNALKYCTIGLEVCRKYLPLNHPLQNGFLGEYKALKSPKLRRRLLENVDELIRMEKLRTLTLPKLNKNKKKLLRYMVIDRRCGFCSEVNENLKACVGCESIYYCNEEHQKLHWKKHKKICKKIQRERRQEEEENKEGEN